MPGTQANRGPPERSRCRITAAEGKWEAVSPPAMLVGLSRRGGGKRDRRKAVRPSRISRWSLRSKNALRIAMTSQGIRVHIQGHTLALGEDA